MQTKLKDFFILMRLHKPVGIFLLLWPTLWGLWLASQGKPDFKIVSIFILGVIVMRSAGCVINDFADRNFDKFVERTRDRPLTTGKISPAEALLVFILLSLIALILVLFLNVLTIQLAFLGALFTFIYPFLKRFTHLPQIGLGIAFAWGVPMAFAAETSAISFSAWELFFAALLWPVIYDTFYAMVDCKDDMKIGIKSTAILFGKKNQLIIGLLQILFLLILFHLGKQFQLNQIYFYSLFFSAVLFCYQLFLIKNREPTYCLKAFLNNQWVGFIIFIGIVLGQSL